MTNQPMFDLKRYSVKEKTAYYACKVKHDRVTFYYLLLISRAFGRANLRFSGYLCSDDHILSKKV